MITIIQKDPCISFISEFDFELINVEIIKSKVDVLVKNKFLRRVVSFIRIDNKNYPSYVKVPQQYNSSHPPPIIDTCRISRIFIQYITINISNYRCWNDCINSDRLNRYSVQVHKVTDVSISTTLLNENVHVLSSKYLLLESLSIAIFDLKNNPLHAVKLKNIMKEVTSVLEYNEIEMDIDCWGGRNFFLIKISPSGNLRYNRFKQKFKSNNYIHQN